MGTPAPTIERETLASIVAVLTRVEQSETDANLTDVLSSAISRVWEFYDGTEFDVSPDTVTSSDVETAYSFLEEHGPTREAAQAYREEHGKPHPNRILNHARDFVDTASRYYIGCLPSFRTWTAKYIYEGEVIGERTYDYEDSIKLTPVIDDVRYKADSTERDPDGTVRVYLSERPFRTDIDVFIHQRTDETVKIEGHDGPNVASETQPLRALEAEFDPERREGAGVIVAEDLEDVVAFADDQGWEYETNDDIQFSK